MMRNDFSYNSSIKIATFKYIHVIHVNMSKIIAIRDVDSELFREFKAEAIKKKMKVGTALNFAMLKFKQELGRKKSKFSDIKPVKWPQGKVNITKEMDDMLYGE